MNLLPDARKKVLMHLYALRLGVVAAYMLTGVLISTVVLMVPAYLYFHQAVEQRSQELAGLGQELAGVEEQQVSARVKTLNANAVYLTQGASKTSVSAVVRALTAVPHPNVRIHGISFSQGAPGKPSTVMLSGSAATREALRTYVSSLKALSYVTTVDLPINAYAKETDIEFSLTLIGSFAL